ncbi:MAG: hypothetical protein IJA10_09760 [Lachnospiraceae bacterium]|nr:hypothetical protein [Lachnospiraceae bacterium]
MSDGKIVVDAYTGFELKNYISVVLANIYESRDFVKAINEYVCSSETRVLYFYR